MTTKHTPGPIAPGPWRVHGKLIQSIDHQAWYTVAKVDNPLFTPESNKANATLIASAPELLEALKGLYNKGWTKEAIEKAGKAIAKAEGRE